MGDIFDRLYPLHIIIKDGKHMTKSVLCRHFKDTS